MKKRIMIVDDSALMRRAICDIISSVRSFEVTDLSRDGLEALEKLRKNKYDVVILDVNMPRMNGLELLERLNKENIKIPIIMASTLTKEDAKETIRALELGAYDFVSKPGSFIEIKGEDFTSRLLKVVREVVYPVGTYHVSFSRRANEKSSKKSTDEPHINQTKVNKGSKLVAIACSTGGPKALQYVIPYLPKQLNAPVLIIQHMPKGFTKSMADRLNEISDITVSEAQDGEVLEKGHVYVAPGGKHLKITTTTNRPSIELNNDPPIVGLRPCANLMFESLKQSSYDEIVSVVLTGMGADGTDGITSLNKVKNVYTISQDKSTCVVYGMPRSIAESGLVDVVAPLQEIAENIIKKVGVR